MLKTNFRFVILMLVVVCSRESIGQNSLDTIKIESRITGLKVALHHVKPNIKTQQYPVLFVHGASFPSALASAFTMNGSSWLTYMADQGFDVYALDFLGYGNSDRYPEMYNSKNEGTPLGRANEVYLDIDRAVNYITQQSRENKVTVIGHSWGASVSALYASKFPAKVHDLVLFAPVVFGNDADIQQDVKENYDVMTPDQRLQAMASLTPQGLSCALEHNVLENWKQTWLTSDVIATHEHLKSVRFPSGPSKDIEDLRHGRPYYDPLQIRVPTLVIRGEWDAYPNAKDADELFKALKNSPRKRYVVIEKSTHVAHLEQNRKQLYEEVKLFISEPIKAAAENQVAVIFEVIPNSDRREDYLAIAKALMPQLKKIEGFISIERFQSISNPEKILSLSFWRNEEAVTTWRNFEDHRAAQTKGRSYIFKDYRLRVVRVIRDYGMFERTEAPMDSKHVHSEHRGNH